MNWAYLIHKFIFFYIFFGADAKSYLEKSYCSCPCLIVFCLYINLPILFVLGGAVGKVTKTRGGCVGAGVTACGGGVGITSPTISK